MNNGHYDSEEYKEKLREGMRRNRVKKFGPLLTFKVKCGTCGEDLETVEHENQFPKKENYYCNRSCANSRGKGQSWYDLRGIEPEGYGAIFRVHHEKKCCCCGEERIVCCHHNDLNHENNDPANLIPLCPTCHMLIHTVKYIDDIKPSVDEYIKNFGAVA